jgi:endonuclease YncB( thermonuclease family)
VSAVHDGDTITVENGPRSYHVRIWGEDAYELKQTCRPHGQEIACGKMAQERVRALIGGRDVSCTVMGKEPYGRVLAQCFTAAKIDIARALIREGLAMEYQSGGIYTADENYAGSHGEGLWDSDEPPQTPKEWRACHHIGRSRPAPGAVCP